MHEWAVICITSSNAYGLFTIIVLGEAIAAATIAVGAAIDAEVTVLPLLTLGIGGLS